MGKLNFWKLDKKQNSKTSATDPSSVNPIGSAAISDDVSRASSPSNANQLQMHWDALQVQKNQVMANYLHQQQAVNGWRSSAEKSSEGVLLRTSGDRYVSHPPELVEAPLAASLRNLNVQAAMTVHSPVIRMYTETAPTAIEVPLLNGRAVQIVSNVESLSAAKTHQCAAVIASSGLLVVWDDDAVELLARAKNIEWEVMQLFWTKDPFKTPLPSKPSSIAPSKSDFAVVNEKQVSDSDSEDLEAAIAKARPTMLFNTCIISISCGCMIAVLGLGFRRIIVEYRYEVGYEPNPYTRFAFMAITPIWVLFAAFFFNIIFVNLSQILGPISQMKMNSKYYSGRKEPRLEGRSLPHVTVQCPIYKEDLKDVIIPTIQSVKRAISTYELQGGTANLFINDDGLQTLSQEKKNERISFYTNNGIGWVARPPHEKDGFQRKGKFKKASNMNFGLSLSCAVEEKLATLERDEAWSSTDEADATIWALEQAIAEGGNIAWADGNIRVGDYILIIDSDTRVPADCFLDAVSELEISPEVAILQFSSGIMQVVHNYFENNITFFTKLIYTAIRFGVSNGDIAPFVGHNAFLRWSALQDIAYEDEGRTKFWSESHVSEDFDLSLRLQIVGYITRLAAWADDGFQEGVSLTVYDELSRWQKYAYGVDELMFNPIRTWLWRGPFTPLLRRFLTSNLPFASKWNMVAYIGSYHAIGSAWITTSANYFIIGWFSSSIDQYYLPSWEIWLSLLVVFQALGCLALAVLRYRIGESGFLSALYTNLKNVVPLYIYFGGLSLHVSQAILAHMFEINMTWQATAKTLEFTNFFVEVPKMLRRFWFTFLFCFVAIAGMIVLSMADFVPYDWRIQNIVAIVPLCSLVAGHLLLPLALNPGLMTFAF